MKLFNRRRPTPADLAPVPVPPTAPAPEPTPKSLLAARAFASQSSAAFTMPPEPASILPIPPFVAGRYVVAYDRNLGPVALAPLTAVATSAADLAEQIRTDVGPYLGGAHRIEVTVDMVVSGGKIRSGVASGTFTFTRGGAR